MMSKSQTWLDHDKSPAGQSQFPPVMLLHHNHAHGKVKNKLSSSSSSRTINRFMTQSTHSQPALILYEVQGCYRFAKKAE
jgi:hypothetical protein